MSWGDAANNILRHAVLRSRQAAAPTLARLRYAGFAATGLQRGRSAQRPTTPFAAVLEPVLPGMDALSCPYDLLPVSPHGHPPHIDVPDGWQPHPETPLEQTLPYPWDHTYRTHFKQPFQPVMLWRNTLALCRYIEKDFDPNQRKLALDVLTQLFARMQEFTVQTDGAAWIENRFDYRNKEVVLPAPWVSGLGNAFALMACIRMRAHLPSLPLARVYAEAFNRPYIAGSARPARWITLRDRRGYLWFEEYPTPRGRPLHVINGHIFAVLALHEWAQIDPNSGADALVRAGATTIAAYAPCVRRPGQISLYAVNWWEKPDYLPARAIRQMYQLYALTGAAEFATLGDQFLADATPHMSAQTLATVLAAKAATLKQRPL